MASENISEKFNEQLSAMIKSENGAAVSSRLVQLRPVTSNVVSSALTGDVIYQYSTGTGEYVDLSKCFQVLRHTFSSTTDYIRVENLCDCAFNRAQLYLNGIMVCSSNNYTQDAIISKRIAKCGGKNKAFGEIDYSADGVMTASNIADGTYESISGLDALFLNTGKSIFVPPNTDIRFIFSADSLMLYKATLGDGSDSTTTLAINDIFMRLNSILSEIPPPADYLIKFLTLDSFKTAVTSANHFQQVQVKPNIVKIGCVFQSSAAESASYTKAYNACHFTWATDGDAEAKELYTLYFKCGSQVIPSERLDVSTYGRRIAYIDFLSENKHDETDAPETLSEWQYQGPVFCYRVVKSMQDSIQNVELVGTFKATPAANSILFSVNEQIVKLSYQNGIPSGVSVAI